ncbi:uncharacterized protein CIMG_10710 [Coccidioides immitis RS]|uniref:Uncharacterized protein n=4 Tax=Coccidioides immitis TaxID=5501 RepID=A0A0D8JTB9_COCIM|nr:uncharacterized protein CIMG_10710 [Coccidioides immitis RS]KJF60191.1 hypothetical protein CIMG_10710 [Coccidioides immitis RS]KMP01202.1 hypothetical protein CIRG_01343 [Coccidioides immitis RMSCC 2394]KMU75519.1 hypothetical protein CISG_05151 [Coccidioides immitis RMSCC 3703]KMU83709.1 hypothetical protein CIHG_01492 [Coccidioides immitis H538.4]
MDQRDSGEVASSTISCSNSLLLHYIRPSNPCMRPSEIFIQYRKFLQRAISIFESCPKVPAHFSPAKHFSELFPTGFPGDADATPSLRHPYLTVLNCLPDSLCLETMFPELWGIRD